MKAHSIQKYEVIPTTIFSKPLVQTSSTLHQSPITMAPTKQAKGTQRMRTLLDSIHSHCVRLWTSRNEALLHHKMTLICRLFDRQKQLRSLSYTCNRTRCVILIDISVLGHSSSFYGRRQQLVVAGLEESRLQEICTFETDLAKF